MYKTFLLGLTGGTIAGLIFKYFLKNQQVPNSPVPEKKNFSEETLVLSDDGEIYKLALVVNNELKMSVGKVMAQCSHAALGLYEKYSSDNAENFELWERKGKPMTIYKVSDSDTLISLQKAAKAQKLCTFLVHDAGRTQIAAGSRTVLAIGPHEIEKLRNIVSYLPLY